ncbi:MAG: DUF1570 domain-containing protein [Vicinamibacterales bacterium]
MTLSRPLGLSTAFRILQVLVLCTCVPDVAIALPASGQTSPGTLENDRTWKQLRSGDLVVVSDDSESIMRQALEELEGFKHVVKVLTPSWNTSSEVQTVLILFKNPSAFDEFKPRDAAGRKRDLVVGYFLRQPHINYMVTYVQPGGTLDLQVILHEYTHFMVSRNVRSVPVWFNEGFAEFYSTFQRTGHDGNPTVGRIPDDRLRTLRSGARVPLEAMLRPDQSWKLTRDDRTVGAFYAQAWALVHYLIIGHETRRTGQLDTYLRRLAEGRSVDDAFEEAFHTTYAGLEKELWGYVQRFTFQALALNQPAPVAESGRRASPMLKRDVLQLHGDILVSVNAPREGLSRLKLAAAVDAGHTPTLASLGRAHMGLEDNAAALAVLRPAAASAPEDFGLQFYLGSALLEAQDYKDAAEASRKAAAIAPGSGSAWSQLSSALLALGQAADSDAALVRAARADSLTEWTYVRAQAAWRFGLDRAVIDDVAATMKLGRVDGQTSAYAALLAAVASWRLRQPAQVMPLLTQARRNTDEREWTTQVLEFALGHMQGADLLRRAKTNGEQTEAHAYWGLKLLFDGQREAAMPHLTWVRDRGAHEYAEYEYVRDVLKLLGEPTGRR